MSDFETSVMNDIYVWAALNGISVTSREDIVKQYWKEYLGE